MTEEQQEIPMAPDATEAALILCGFEHLDGKTWHIPGGIAAEITQCGEVKLSFVSTTNGFTVSIGPLHRDMVQATLWLFRQSVTRLNELHG